MPHTRLDLWPAAPTPPFPSLFTAFTYLSLALPSASFRAVVEAWHGSCLRPLAVASCASAHLRQHAYYCLSHSSHGLSTDRCAWNKLILLPALPSVRTGVAGRRGGERRALEDARRVHFGECSVGWSSQ